MNATVELREVTKDFSGVKALDRVSLKAFAGHCLGLVGENGAGKSTLMKVLSGIWTQGSFDGQILLNGVHQEFSGPQDALNAGISIIHQELALFDELSVAENIFLSHLPSRWGLVDRESLDSRASEILARLGLNLSPEEKVRNLSVGQKQLVEIAKAFSRPPKVLIFDEPTSALTDREIEVLFQLVDDIKSKGVACIYISHKLDEIDRLCEHVTVLRDGQSVASFTDKAWTSELLIEAMVGRKMSHLFPPKRPLQGDRKTLLKVDHLSLMDSKTKRAILDDVSFEVKEGEIFGIAGLMGSRRSELLLSLFGCGPGVQTGGSIVLDGQALSLKAPQDAIEAGFGLVTEDRKLTGLFLKRSIRENMTLPILRTLSQYFKIRDSDEREIVDYYCKVLRVKAASLDGAIQNLSGGNQQKVIIGRWLSSKPRILLLDEPTRGIDVRAKAEIYFLIRELVDQGLTLMIVSSELPEVVSLSDRVMVMKQGRVAGMLEGSQISQKAVMERAVA